MPELDDAALERRLRGVLQERLGALPLDLTVDALDRRREAKGVAPRSGRGRAMTLLAAAALLVVGGALAAGSGILRLATVVPPVPEPSVIAVATASPDATSEGPSESAAPSASPIPVAGPGGVWIPVGTMGTPRAGQDAVRLLDGRVLVVGGSGGESDQATAELYDPASGRWSATGSMLKARAGFPPTLLLDGKVLMGHVDDAAADPGASTVGAEVYDPDGGTWTATGKMVRGTPSWAADFGLTATLLGDGKVLVAGQGGAQVYDPDSGIWSATGQMITPRHSHTATLLRDGSVLAVGGYDGGDFPLGSAELYDPDTASWSAIASTHFDPPPSCPGCAGGYGWATLLQDGTLLFMRTSGEVEIYDPASGTWTSLAQPTQFGYPMTLLSDGTVLAARDVPDPCAGAVLYDPRTGSSTTASSMLRCGRVASFTLLLDGAVLVAGGSDCNDETCVATGTSALYVPAGVPLPPLPLFPSPPPPVFPSPTPRPTPLAPTTGPVPPNARSWKVTVDNQSSEPAGMFVAEEGEGGTLRLVGSATPNVVPAGTTVQVTFLFPANDDGWIYVNPRPGEGGSLVNADQIGTPGKILIRAEEGDVVWASP
jgi:hypothetical protein